MKGSKWMRYVRVALAGAAVCGALAGAVARAGPPAPAADKPAATGHGEGISFGQGRAGAGLGGPVSLELPEAQRRELQREALSLLIDDLLLQQFLRKHVPPTSPAEVEKKMV